MGACSPSEEDDYWRCLNDPKLLKDKGNELFGQGSVTEAIDVWKQGLKAALKKSIREPSFELTELQTTLRMNLALGFMKDDDFIMAKEHMTVVYENAPHTPKIFYRLAAVYRGLHDERKALDIIAGGLTLFPGDAALIDLRNQIAVSEKKSKSDGLGKRVDLSALADEREAVTSPDLLLSDLLDMDDDELIGTLIDWRFKSTKLISPDEVIDDVDDWQTSLLWNTPFTRERLADDKTVLHLSLPFSILKAIENLLRRNQDSDTNLASRNSIKPLDRKYLQLLPPLPSFTCGRSKALREHLLTRLSLKCRGSSRPFTIHVLGARGDHEMESKWSAMLQRLPHCDHLQVIMIGFIDDDDQYNRKLIGQEYLSPPLVKNAGFRHGQKFIARLYKGTYHQFINSQLVAKETRTEHLKPIMIPLKDNKHFELPPMLAYDSHPFNPDLVIIPEPNLSRHFESWIPSICPVLLSNVPMMIFGHSALEMPSHEALQIPSIMQELNARPITRLSWNPFMIAIQPAKEFPPMPLVTADGKEILYSGLSAKFAVVGTYQSTIGKSPEEIEIQRSLLAELSDGQNVGAFKTRLKLDLRIDVDRESEARREFREDELVQRQIEEEKAQREELVEKTARELTIRLKGDTCTDKVPPTN